MSIMVVQNNFVHFPSYDSPQLRSKLMNSEHGESPDKLIEGKSYNIIGSKPKNSHSQAHSTNRQKSEQPKEADMSNVTRDEIQALLKANKAEVDAVSSEMRREMAEWREQNSNQLNQIANAINALSSKVDGKMSNVDGEVKAINGRFEGLQGQISGINTAISGMQSGISTRLAFFGVIIAVVVAIPSLVSSLRESPAPQQQVAQPIVIQVPQQPLAQQPPPVQQPSKN